jgi:TRAP-type C4-dicarboxylate transport system substrate-binding protein
LTNSKVVFVTSPTNEHVKETPVKMPNFFQLSALAFCALTAASASAQQEIKMTVCSGQAPVFSFVRLIGQSFIPTVNAELAKTGKMKITWNEAYAGTLAKVGGELEAMQQGICDMGVVGLVFHPAKLPLQQVSFMAPFGPTDLRPVVKVMNDMNRNHPQLRGAWEKQNQVFLAGTAVDDYGLFANFPVSRYEDVNGKKIASSPAPLSWLKGTGATGVNSGLPSYYNDLKSGVYGGVLTFLTAAAPIKLFEVAPFYTQTGMGSTFPGALTMNKQTWDKLGAEGQAAVRTAADTYAARYVTETQMSVANGEAAFKAGGGKVMSLSPAERDRWAKAIENPAKAWIAQNGQPARDVLKAYMDALRAEGVKFLRDWDKE